MMRVIPLESLRPHPANPRLEAREEIVDRLTAQILEAGGFDEAHALIVRPIGDVFEIVSGHHRRLAAERAGLVEVPCHVREMTDHDAYMSLALCNTQSELHPLEEGRHAAESGLDLKSYASRVARERSGLQRRAMAWRVLSVCDIAHVEARDRWSCLSEIHPAPSWLWPALVDRLVADGWTVEATRQQVKRLAAAPEPPAWADRAAIGQALVEGRLRLSDLEAMPGAVERAAVRDADLRARLMDELERVRPASVSAVEVLCAGLEVEQAERDRQDREAEIAARREHEMRFDRAAALRSACSLSAWKELPADEQAALLEVDDAPAPSTDRTTRRSSGRSGAGTRSRVACTTAPTATRATLRSAGGWRKPIPTGSSRR